MDYIHANQSQAFSTTKHKNKNLKYTFTLGLCDILVIVLYIKYIKLHILNIKSQNVGVL